MRNKKQIKISIPTPCQENWENMTPNERGRHCANCNKTVVDFSLFTDKQLVEFFNKTIGNVCGRFHSYQLNRELVYTEPRNHFLYKLLFGTALTLGIAGSASATSLVNMRPLMEQYGLKNIDNHEENPIAGGDSTNYVKGTVIDKETKEALPFANVILLNQKEIVSGVQTDIDGRFSIQIPPALIGKKLQLVTNYIGYKDDTISVSATHLPVNIELKTGPQVILGGVMWVPVEVSPYYTDSSDPFINADKQTLKGDDLPH